MNYATFWSFHRCMHSNHLYVTAPPPPNHENIHCDLQFFTLYFLGFLACWLQSLTRDSKLTFLLLCGGHSGQAFHPQIHAPHHREETKWGHRQWTSWVVFLFIYHIDREKQVHSATHSFNPLFTQYSFTEYGNPWWLSGKESACRAGGCLQHRSCC